MAAPMPRRRPTPVMRAVGVIRSSWQLSPRLWRCPDVRPEQPDGQSSPGSGPKTKLRPVTYRGAIRTKTCLRVATQGCRPDSAASS